MNSDVPNANSAPPITESEIRRAARAELVSPITVYRALLGLEVRGLAGERARRVVAKLRSGAR